jgi:hypothetical protein
MVWSIVWKVLIGAIVGVSGVFATLILVGNGVWRSRSEELRTELLATTVETELTEFDETQLEGVPKPVAEYFSHVLRGGQNAVTSVRIAHSGTFNMGSREPQWRPFSSTQDVVIAQPGFLWNARIGLAPGLSARVHDAYVNGRGVLTARLLGLFTVMESPDSPELAHGELMRFLAEAPWYPTALLPRPKLSWSPIDDSSARLSLTENGTEVSLEVRFDDNGVISSVYSDGRYRDDGGTLTKVPWEGRFWNYQERHGMLIPLDGEAAWILPEGRLPYWRGHIEEIQYDFAH